MGVRTSLLLLLIVLRLVEVEGTSLAEAENVILLGNLDIVVNAVHSSSNINYLSG